MRRVADPSRLDALDRLVKVLGVLRLACPPTDAAPESAEVQEAIDAAERAMWLAIERVSQAFAAPEAAERISEAEEAVIAARVAVVQFRQLAAARFRRSA